MSKPNIVLFSSIVEANGKTIKQNNLELQHNLPVGQKVYSRYMKEFGEIKSLGRDCDGTPLYQVAIEYSLGEDDLIKLKDYIEGNYEKRTEEE